MSLPAYSLSLETMFDEEKRRVSLKLTIRDQPPEIEQTVNEESIHRLLVDSGYQSYFVFQDMLPEIIEDIQRLHANPPGFDENGIAQFGTPPVAEARDGSATIQVNDDKTEAILTIVPAMGGKHLIVDNIRALLTENNICHGVIDAAIEEAVSRAALGENDDPIKCCIAEATAPQKGENTQFESLVATVSERVLKPKLREDGTIDMRELGDLPVVSVGSPLLKKIPFTEGVDGIDIFGEQITAEAGEDIPFKLADGAAISAENANLLIATIEGQPDRIAHGMKVSPAVRVDAVDLSTGNIDIDSSLIVAGDIIEGMIVKCSGDITVGGVIESAQVTAGGNVMVAKGIVGKTIVGKNLSVGEKDQSHSVRIKAGGNISAVFASNATLISKNEIQLDEQLLHCDCIGEEITVGSGQRNPGQIVGGLVRAIRYVEADSIGAQAGIRTLINFDGALTAVEVEKNNLDNQASQMQKQYQDLLRVYGKLERTQASEEQKQKNEKIKNTISHLSSQLDEIHERQHKCKIDRITAMEKVSVAIKKKLYPNVEVSIGKRFFKSNRAMENGEISVIDGELKFSPKKFN